MSHNVYRFCAKCAADTPPNGYFVCDACRGTRGYYRYCAECGKPLIDGVRRSRNYIHGWFEHIRLGVAGGP